VLTPSWSTALNDQSYCCVSVC